MEPPGGLVGQGPFLPSDLPVVQTQASKPVVQALRSGKSDDPLHPNQLLRDFRPSVRLPDNFVHQINNLIINPDSGEVFQPAESMKKMIFPNSSEEIDSLQIITQQNPM